MWGKGCVDVAQVGQGLCGGQCPCGARVVWSTVPVHERRGAVCWTVPRQGSGEAVEECPCGAVVTRGQRPIWASGRRLIVCMGQLLWPCVAGGQQVVIGVPEGYQGGELVVNVGLGHNQPVRVPDG